MAFTTTRAERLRWINEPTGVGRASDIAKHQFCAHCGNPMTWEAEDDPNDMAISTGTLDDLTGIEISIAGRAGPISRRCPACAS